MEQHRGHDHCFIRRWVSPRLVVQFHLANRGQSHPTWRKRCGGPQATGGVDLNAMQSVYGRLVYAEMSQPHSLIPPDGGR